MASTKPLSDAFARVVAYGTDVVNDQEVRKSVRQLGEAVIGVGRAVAQVNRNRQAPGSGDSVWVPKGG